MSWIESAKKLTENIQDINWKFLIHTQIQMNYRELPKILELIELRKILLNLKNYFISFEKISSKFVLKLFELNKFTKTVY